MNSLLERSSGKRKGDSAGTHEINMEKLKRAKEFLGKEDSREIAPSEAEMESVSRTQGAIDAFHRTTLGPMMAHKPSGKVGRANHESKLREVKAVHGVMKEISQDKTIPIGEREERVKGMLHHGMQISGDYWQ